MFQSDNYLPSKTYVLSQLTYILSQIKAVSFGYGECIDLAPVFCHLISWAQLWNSLFTNKRFWIL